MRKDQGQDREYGIAVVAPAAAVPESDVMPDNGTPAPGEAYRHMFLIVAVWPNGAGTIRRDVSASDLHAVKAELERGGAFCVIHYTGEA